MKKLIPFLVIILVWTLVGCSNNESIDGYEYGDFDRFNSYASVNGLDGTDIYIKGVVKSVHDFDGYCNITIESEDEGRWIANSMYVTYNESLEVLLVGENVTCYGQYHGFSDVYSMPVILFDKIAIGDREYTVGDLAYLE